MKTQTATSSPRSRRIWLLWLVPLLTPAPWFLVRYYPQNVEVRSFVRTKPEPRPYTLLSNALAQYPYAKKFTIRIGISVTRTKNSEKAWFNYNRATLTLDEFVLLHNAQYMKSWAGVSESAIESVAKFEQEQASLGKYIPSVFFSGRLLRQQGAKNISSEKF